MSGVHIMLMQQEDHPQADNSRALRSALRRRPIVRRNDYDRRRFLACLRDEVAILRALGLDHRGVADLLDIEEQDVRALCPKTREKPLRRNLPRRAVGVLLHGRHASLGGRTVAERSRRLVKIAAAYSRDELMAEPGVGSVTAIRIQLWLEERGASLRKPEDATTGGSGH